MTTDKDTGLPELPKGYVWRIKEEGFGLISETSQTLVLEICQKSWWGNLTVITSDNLLETYTESLPPTLENIQKRARRAYRSFTREMGVRTRRAEESKARQKLVGTYPPKKLNY